GCLSPVVADGDRQRAGQTALAGRAERRSHHVSNGLVEHRVWHEDENVLRAALGLDALTVLRRPTIYVARDRRRADEGHPADGRMVQNRVDGGFAAIDQVEHAGGEAGLIDELEDQLLR